MSRNNRRQQLREAKLRTGKGAVCHVQHCETKLISPFRLLHSKPVCGKHWTEAQPTLEAIRDPGKTIREREAREARQAEKDQRKVDEFVTRNAARAMERDR